VSTGAVWAAILSSVTMGLAGLCLFVFAVKRHYFSDVEDAKYHVFWSDLPTGSRHPEEHDGHSSPRR
jgi:hypothetical protein